MNAPYEVGYGKPPIKSQFKKGKSGNPGGRPKIQNELPRDFQTSLGNELKALITVTENGKKKKMPQLQAVIKSQIAHAINGDKTATKHILDLAQKLPPNAFEDDGVTYYRITKKRREALEELVRTLRSIDPADLYPEPPEAGTPVPEIGAGVAKADTTAVCDGKPVVEDGDGKKA
jgi:hypothetical protein